MNLQRTNSEPQEGEMSLDGQAKPRVLYVSYDGASEPLGRSQVVSYLVPLASSADITLISFEKPGDDRRETADILARAGIRWLPLRYHKSPPVLSTVWDIVRGSLCVAKAVRDGKVQIVHTRSYVAGVMAIVGRRRRPWRFLFDIRGFWVDERVEGGIWPKGGWLFRSGKRCEKWLFRSADRIVTLTQSSVIPIQGLRRDRDVPIDVIPTCADLERYAQTKSGAPPRLVWCGSIGTFYRFDLAAKLAARMGQPLFVLTRQIDSARSLLGDQEAEVRSVPHEQVPRELFAGDIGLCLYGDGISNLARAPTRFAEYLAAGMAVVVTPGVGDLPALVQEHRVGTVLAGDSPEDLDAVVAELEKLRDDPDLPARGRALADKLFSLEAGVEAYRRIYRELIMDSSADHSEQPQTATVIG